MTTNNDSTPTELIDKPLKHWFYEKIVDGKKKWTPFTYIDSANIEEAFQKNCEIPVTTDGGRFEVNIAERTRTPIYWTEESTAVRRCNWFFKVDNRWVPYEEGIADMLECDYQECLQTNEWHKRISLPNEEQIVFHDKNVMVHFQQSSSSNTDAWGSPVSAIAKPRVVKRGIEDFHIEDGDTDQIDFLLFMVHGIGSVCDLRMRTVEEVVDEFRSIAQQLVVAHYKTAYDECKIGRVEVLPVSWYKALHSEESGIDLKLKNITLDSIPRLRNFTNETVLDVLFYTSPIFSQNIINTVANSLNKKYSLFIKRNPNFNGGVSLAGHSLGSLILFDLLCNQKPIEVNGENLENPYDLLTPVKKKISVHQPIQRTQSKPIEYTFGMSGTGQALIKYPQLIFEPKQFFALGSPIGMFVTIRGIDKLGVDFQLPTCDSFFNIFHPYDPVAYRIEPLVNAELASLNPFLIPHHKGRKRMHLELKETLQQVSADIKTKFMTSVKNVTETVCALNPLNKSVNQKSIEKEADEVLNEQLKMEGVAVPSPESPKQLPTELNLGILNQGRRIDNVLQEAPLEFINEYVWALQSHVCYWSSPDTILFIVKEIYTTLGIEADKEIPQHTMKIERPGSTDLLVPSSSG